MIEKQSYLKQIIGGTSEDSEKEKYPKEFFEDLLKGLPEKIPLNQKHESGLPTVGFLENFDLIRSKELGEWDLIADVHVTSGELDKSFTGFSLSATVVEWGNKEFATECIHIPYPYYNDQRFIDELLADSDSLVIGKWIKKEAVSLSTIAIAVFIQGVALLIGPEWDIQYKKEIRPRILNAIDKIKKLNDKSMSVDFVQLLKGYQGETIKLYFIPDRDFEEESYSEKKVGIGIQRATSFISRDIKAKTVGVSQLKLKYDTKDNSYKLFDINYLDNAHKTII